MKYLHHNISTKIINLTGKKDLLFLHGYTSNKNAKDKLWSQFPHYRVHAIDFPAHGATSTGNDLLSLEEFGKIANCYLQEHHLTNVTVFGHSMGGGTAGFVNPKYVSQFILLCPLNAEIYERRHFLQELFLPRNLSSYENLLKKLTHQLSNNKTISEQEMKHFLRQQASNFAVYQPLAKLSQAILNKQTLQKLTTNWNKTFLPVHIIAGETDEIITLDSLKQLKDEISNASLDVIPNCGHLPDQEKPLELVKILQKYLPE